MENTDINTYSNMETDDWSQNDDVIEPAEITIEEAEILLNIFEEPVIREKLYEATLKNTKLDYFIIPVKHIVATEEHISEKTLVSDDLRNKMTDKLVYGMSNYNADSREAIINSVLMDNTDTDATKKLVYLNIFIAYVSESEVNKVLIRLI